LGSDFELVVAKGGGNTLHKNTMPVQRGNLIVNYINMFPRATKHN